MPKYVKIKKAIIPCAGYGTRFMPATKGTPKELFPVVDKPAILYHLQECYKSGIREVLIITSEIKKPYFQNLLTHNLTIEDAMKKSGTIGYLDELNEIIDNMKIDYLVQKKMNGTGSAVALAKEWVNGEPFAMMFGDDLFDEYGGKPALSELIELFDSVKDGKTVIGARLVTDEELKKYNSIRTTKQIEKNWFAFDKIIEKPQTREEAPSNLSCLGRYLFQSDVFDYIERGRKENTVETPITDAIDLMAKENGCYCVSLTSRHFDLGSKSESIIAICEFALANPKLRDGFVSYLKNLKL